MTTNAQRITKVQFAGDVSFPLSASAVNPSSPASEILMSLVAGDNVIPIPTIGAVATAVMIIKPSSNTALIKLKSVSGDAGIPLNKTDYDIISLDASATQIVLNAASEVDGVRLVWM